MSSPDSPILWQVGPLVVHWYGFLMVCAVLSVVYIARTEANRRREKPEHVWNMTMWCLILGLIGARLYHVFSSPPGASRDFTYYFIEHPFAVLTLFGIPLVFPTALFIWQGGIGIFGAILGGVMGIIIYTRRHHLNLWTWLDIAAVAMLLGQAIGRWGNFFNQELYGLPTRLPWGITITNVNQRLPPYNDLTKYPLDALFHPVFLYESLWNLLGFILLWWLARKHEARLQAGDLFGLYLIWYSAGRLWLEMLRPDAWAIGGLAVAQIVSLGLIIGGLGLLYQHHWRSKPPPRNKVFKVHIK